MAGENERIVRAIEEAWNTNSLDKLDDMFEKDFVQHSGMPGMPATLDTAKMGHSMSLQAFPDRKTVIEDLVADGDQVAIRIRMTGTNTGGMPWFKIPANNRAVNIEWISFYRLRDGKVTEHHAVMDLVGLMQQLQES